MEIIVCVKHVPETAEVELKIDKTGRDIEKSGLVFDINEWDDYAVEEAIRIKEKLGGNVTVITVGSEDADSTLRKCLAKGADKAIRITDKRINTSDPYIIAKILSKTIKEMPFDLILTGAQSSDDGYAFIGPALAELLDIPHVTLAKKIEFKDRSVIVNRELEGGLEEVVEVELPALITIQTGINEPRYVSIMGIRKAMKKEIKTVSIDDLGLSESEVGIEGSWIHVSEMYIPSIERRAEFIRGTPEEVTSKIIEIIKSRGVI
ncbi:MAG: electron transfer flavoprotein subunit beta/FixA family protein [Thaumarchaeota archaeon]|jgi:electron transfer flavoprotein beta subunit|nr:electron transfer flavoprotein subunit beta/FixA family protein [Candidatus Geocrenenecus arthurdayi]MCL7390756.1 electron transfer flavoprotein subunit beta/FixA family protein [Candidatus Geocrenenecus arthurdayi]MCL7402940.1 electron transfer flavoprotein subunit beta/FixA family protein [Candidatus Geocrenenecus arthurdayi]